MRKLGVYIGDTVYGHGDAANVEKNTFVWYETIRSIMNNGSDVYDLSIWSLNGGYPKCAALPNGRKPDAKLKTTELKSIKNTVIPIKEVTDKYCIEWRDQTWRIQECTVYYDYSYDYEHITDLKVNHIGSNVCSWSWEGEQAMSTLKNAKVNPIYKMPNPLYDVSYLTMPGTVGDMIKEELKKSLEKSALNSFYGVGGFTTNPDPFKVVKIAEKETKTMTETDTFLKHINGITITSTYSKLDFGDFGDPYYIYYPEMEITEDMADTLLTVLLMAKREYIHKVIFNPEKGTTTIYRNKVEPITVRCRDGEFDYILGYNMARNKMYLGADDYNWFNKIKNHRKTHIEYTEKPTEPKTKKTSKKGGKK